MALQNAFGDIALEQTQVENAGSLSEITLFLQAILSRLGYPDPATASLRANIVGGTLPTVTTVTTVTTVSTVTSASNLVAIGGTNAIYDQYSAMQQCIAPIRAAIAVS